MSSNTYVENIQCTKCGSSNGMGIYKKEDGSIFGKCFKCSEVDHNPYGSIEPSEQKSKKENSSVKREDLELIYNKQASFNSLKSRGISKDACEKYGVKSILDEDGNDTIHFYPVYDSTGNESIAVRIVEDKKFSWINSNPQLEFFGQKVAGSSGKMIIITEGVCDCLAVVDMLAKQGKSYRTVSVNNGSASLVKAVQENYEWLNTFENIFFAFDQDDPGQDAVKKAADLFPPNKVKNIKFSEKDPNDMLRKNKHVEFLQAIYNAKETRPDGIVSVDDLYEEAIKPPEIGLSFPWPTLTEATYGYRDGELWGIGAGSGCGKTEFFKECIDHTINYHKEVAGVIFLEEPAAKTLKVLAGKKAKKRFHIPADKGGDWTIDELVDGINDLKGKVYLYNHFGAKDWESIKPKIRYMVSALGIKRIYLDHLTALVAQEDNEYKALNRLMEEMSSLCQELNCTIFYISHLRKASGTPHEEGGRVTADQFKGSGAIVFWSNFLIGLERNQQAEDIEERNTTTLRVLKDRNTGLATGVTFKLKYSHETGRWGELDEDEFNEDF